MQVHCKWIANAMQVHRFSSIFLAVLRRAAFVVLHLVPDMPFKVDVLRFRPIGDVVKAKLNALANADLTL